MIGFIALLSQGLNWENLCKFVGWIESWKRLEKELLLAV